MSKITQDSLRVVSKNLDAAIREINEGSADGLKLAMAFVSGESVERAPVEFGVLRNSAYSDVEETPTGAIGRAGFTAKYAPMVHEAPMKLRGLPRKGRHRGVYWQGGENKFLKKAIDQNHDTILRLIQRGAKI